MAFILAFVFRAFIVEAFVIPTGSMAATLYGKHGTLVCSDCGWENVYGLTDRSTRPPRYGPDAVALCQNCNHGNTDLSIHDGAGRGVPKDLRRRGNAQSGDRILVLKWPLNIGGSFLDPNRWDVTVFKNPSNGNENYIKRLVGLPGEVLEIIDGDVYTVPVGQLSDETIEVLDEWRRIKYRLRTNQSTRTQGARKLARGATQAALDELAEKLRISVKTPEAQDELWTVVYDHDYPPKILDNGQPYWSPDEVARGSQWTTTGRRLAFDGASGGRATVRFAGKAIDDRNAYNIDIRPRMWRPVADVRIEAVLHPRGGDGYLQLVLTKHDDAFAVRLDADGRIALVRFDPGRPAESGEMLAEATTQMLVPGRPIAVAFTNVDYRVSFAINGEEVLATTPDQYAPDIKALRSRREEVSRSPWITAADIDVELRHVVLYRDGFYTSPLFDPRSPIGGQARTSGWGTTGNPILLREGEYFMLGDNSPASKDSRLWDHVGDHLTNRGEDYQMGTVPADQIVGRAFFVYWPSGLRPDWLPLLRNWGVVPNVGEMRWIR
ncbi:MAG: hypothetical protein IID39_03945 [Planctomycetes bacterium]|nr:hypothetical protein [Planctomycetota bacterium]